MLFFFFSSRRRHTRFDCDWSSDVCSSDLVAAATAVTAPRAQGGFFRHRSTITRAYRSLKTPPSAEAATKPGSEKRDRIDLGFFMRSTLLQNLHRFQAGLDSRKPLSGEPFMHRLTAEAPT